MSALAALALCALLGGDKVELRFAPKEGSQLRHTISLDHTLGPTLSVHQQLRTLDEYRQLGEGRPLLLRRKFEEIGWTSNLARQRRADSPLRGTSVVYTWVPGEGTYGKYYDALESNESSLRYLEEDLDLRALLPRGAVAAGDSWNVPADKLRDVFAPAGRLDMHLDMPRGLAGDYGELFGGESKGECKLTLASVADHKLATVELSIQLQEKRGDASWNFEGQGTLVWDLGANHAVSLQLQGAQKLAFGSEPAREGKLSFAWRIEDAPPQGQK